MNQGTLIGWDPVVERAVVCLDGHRVLVRPRSNGSITTAGMRWQKAGRDVFAGNLTDEINRIGELGKPDHLCGGGLKPRGII